jgi:hypothetical protein
VQQQKVEVPAPRQQQQQQEEEEEEPDLDTLHARLAAALQTFEAGGLQAHMFMECVPGSITSVTLSLHASITALWDAMMLLPIIPVHACITAYPGMP